MIYIGFKPRRLRIFLFLYRFLILWSSKGIESRKPDEEEAVEEDLASALHLTAGQGQPTG
jgi:hypothetical protein